MIPKSGLFGGVPATPENGAPEHLVATPPPRKGPEKEFFDLMSQAVAKKTDQPAVSQPPRASTSFVAPDSGAVKKSGAESETHSTSTADGPRATEAQSPKATVLQENFIDASVSSGKFFVKVSQASAKRTDRSAVSQRPRATTSFAPPKSVAVKTSDGESEIRPTSTDDTSKAKDIQLPAATVPQENLVDASALSAIMALLAPPLAPPTNLQTLVPHGDKEFDLTAEQGDGERGQVNKSNGQEPPHKQAISAAPSGLPADQPPAPVVRPAIQVAISPSDDPGKSFPASTGLASSTPTKSAGDGGKSYRVDVSPTPNESPPSKFQWAPVISPQIAVIQDIAVESREVVGATGVIDGTRAALSNQRMKSVVQKNEFAGRSAQKMPESAGADNSAGDAVAKVTAKSDSTLSGHPNQSFDPEMLALVSANSTLAGALEGKSGEKTQADDKISAQLERVNHLVTQEVLMVKQSGANSLAVSLKVDSHTELFLQLTNHDGQIHASIRCERGNVESLGSRWGELQESLARQNVQLMPFEDKASSRSNAAANGSPEPATSRAFDQSSQNRRQQSRDPQDEPALAGVAGAAIPARKTKTNNRSRQGWETWA